MQKAAALLCAFSFAFTLASAHAAQKPIRVIAPGVYTATPEPTSTASPVSPPTPSPVPAVTAAPVSTPSVMAAPTPTIAIVSPTAAPVVSVETVPVAVPASDLTPMVPGTAGQDPVPDMLRVRQMLKVTTLANNIFLQKTYPNTQNESVNTEIAALVDTMTDRLLPLLPSDPPQSSAYLDVGPIITRSGTSWMSFLTLAEISRDREALYTEFDARVYDLSSGLQLRMTDLFDADSDAWSLLADEIHRQLTEAFPGVEPNQTALNHACTRESIEQASFTLSAGCMRLTYHAGDFYPGRNTLLHVTIYYSTIRPMMKPEAQLQTDNAHYKAVALTYDDGGARGYTRMLLRQLRNYASEATFFIVGEMMAGNHDNMSHQQNAAYSIQTHTYDHELLGSKADPQRVFALKERMAAEVADIIGIPPTLMRAPGGNETWYVDNSIGYPLIHWSLPSGDSNKELEADRISRKVTGNIVSGDVVLMHDINAKVSTYSADILEYLMNRGFLCVTVEELYELCGVPLTPNVVTFAPTWDGSNRPSK